MGEPSPLGPEMPLGSEARTGQRETCGATGHASKGLVQVSPKNLDSLVCHYLLVTHSSPMPGSPV